MRLLAMVISAVLLCCPAVQAQVRTYDEMIAAGELKVAVYKDFAPYSFEDAGQPRGVDVELADALAKALGVKVLRFSIGFGPPIVAFTRGDTEYRIAWFPLGGYVKMAGEQPYDELPPEEAKYGFLAQAPWKRMLIVAAGPVFNLVFPVLCFFAYYLLEPTVIAPVVGQVEVDTPAERAGRSRVCGSA